MPEHLGCLEESTNVVKGNGRLPKLLLIVSYLIIYAASLMVFWFFTDDALGYSIMFLGVLLPVTTFVVSFLIGKNGYCGKWKWLSPIVLGVMHMLAEYATFSAANMITFVKLNAPDFGMIPVGTMISSLGMGLGAFAKFLRKKINVRKQNG